MSVLTGCNYLGDESGGWQLMIRMWMHYQVMNASWLLIVQDSQNLELGGDGDMLIEIGATWIVPRRLDMSMSVGRR